MFTKSLAVAMVLALAACTERGIDVTMPEGAVSDIGTLTGKPDKGGPGRVGTQQTKQWCDTHPGECPGATPDPFPNEPGYYLGSDATWNSCMSGPSAPGGDIDQDGMGDECERWVAEGFAPELFHSAVDQWMGRESYWAVMPAGTQTVTIFYAIAYYLDGGAWDGICNTNPQLQDCLGHSGDSETIVVHAEYNSATTHWTFKNAL